MPGADEPIETPAVEAGEERAALYPGDRGELPLEARRVLVQLLAGPSLDGRRHGRLWPSLLQYRDRIESRLGDLFLELVVDTDAQVAFVRQADTGELETPVLLRRTPLTFLESVLLLHLRRLLADAELRGERAVVSLDEMMDHMRLYERNLNTDQAGFERRAKNAIASLLTPPQWLAYNAAAREGERHRRDRNLVSYVRGAWGDRTDSASGEIATHFLRRGTTWSALALTFANGEGRKVTLVHIYWIRGSGTATTDVRRHYLIAERDFDIATELDGFDLDLRALKRRLMDVDHFGDTFRPYGERFRRLLDIESEQALKLLHKTQSAKNLGDLNTFLREFMLELPDTFEAAERLVAEFAELDAAHREVVEARRQVETLRPAREEHERLQTLEGEIAGNERLLEAIDAWTEARRIGLLDAAMAGCDARILGLEGEIRQTDTALGEARAELRALEAEHRARGGDRIEALQDEARRLEVQREERLARRRRLEADCRALGWTPPADATAFGRLLVEAREYIDAREAAEEAEQARRDQLRDRLREAEAEFAALRYQLGGSESGLPRYAAVVLDEAFGKADNEFTELAMRIFERFGFQMIVATPLKAVMTLEPLIGGACFVEIADRKDSRTLPITYDEAAGRLDLPARKAHGERASA